MGGQGEAKNGHQRAYGKEARPSLPGCVFAWRRPRLSTACIPGQHGMMAAHAVTMSPKRFCVTITSHFSGQHPVYWVMRLFLVTVTRLSGVHNWRRDWHLHRSSAGQAAARDHPCWLPTPRLWLRGRTTPRTCRRDRAARSSALLCPSLRFGVAGLSAQGSGFCRHPSSRATVFRRPDGSLAKDRVRHSGPSVAAAGTITLNPSSSATRAS